MRRDMVWLLLPLLGACDLAGPGTSVRDRAVTSPTEVAGNRPSADLAAGYFHSCALGADGMAYCWGSNEYLQLGVADSPQQCETFACARTPVPVSGGYEFVRIAAGITHSCALGAAGDAFCWGGGYEQDNAGWLGDGRLSRSALPVAVAADSPFVAITAGALDTCALTAAGAAYCWGRNVEGELGDGTITDRLTPVAVRGDLRFRSISLGGAHACGVTVDGSAYCWGSNRWGQLGVGEVPPNSFGLRSLEPVRVQIDERLSVIAAGGAHTCALAESGRAFCWGQDAYGQLGDRTARSNSGLPIAVADDHVFESLAAGDLTTCAVTPGGDSWCWGSNYFGALGDGTTSEGGTDFPVRTKGGSFGRVVPGGSHTCGLTTNQRLLCWGDRFYGQVGAG